MLVGVVYDPASCAPCDAAHVVKMSTRRYECARESGRAKAKRETEARLARARAPGGVTPLNEALQCVPSARVASTNALQAHLRALAPLLGAWLGVHRVRAVRRARFRDASLDALCHRICGHRRSRRDGSGVTPTPLPTLVAFGAASSCSTGFGYAPAPQKRLRLRRRLELHGARVSLIDEFRTSQMCSCCGSRLQDVFAPLRPKQPTARGTLGTSTAT